MCRRERLRERAARVCHKRESDRGLVVARRAWRGTHLARPRRSRKVSEPVGVARAAKNLRIAQRDVARLSRSDGEDPGADEAVSGKLDQRGIAVTADDLLIDRPRASGVHRLALQLLFALKQRKIREDCFAGQWIDIVPL